MGKSTTFTPKSESLKTIYMMKHRLFKFLGCFVLAIMSTSAFAQSGSLKGSVMDDTDQGLIGASVVLKGTTKGTVTDINGNFQLDGLPSGSQTFVISYIGFSEVEQTVSISNGQTADLGSITMESDAVGLDEIMVIASVAIDRKTPVAVSSIKSAEIEAKIGSQEFPEILKSTPGVYATKSGGGFGDGRISVRGFNDDNVAVMINGVPVNDMENGRVYWSNWAGLTDATSSMQVQRGLGASKIAVPSIGGTINIISKASDRKKGGHFYVGTGNDNYKKHGFSLSSGLTDDGWAFTISGSRTEGEGYVDGTQFLGYSYFANIAKQINDNHEITFTAIGAQQRHGQRQNQQSLEAFENSERGIKYNADWGYKNGQVLHIEDNFYHKPQLSFNHYWTINSTTELSTAVYASFGTGGGGGNADGQTATGEDNGEFEYNRVGGQYGPVDIDWLVERNQNTADGNAMAFLRASRNDHNWFGALSTLNKEVNENLKILGGLDLRYYKGKHFREVTDLLGADYAYDDSDINQPVKAIRVGDKFSYNNDGIVNWTGLFGQAEYTKDQLAAFVSLAASNTSYKRIDYFNYLDSDPEQETDNISFLGFQVKGGANYNLDDNHNVYANVGYFEKAPGFDAVFQNFQNDVNEDAENQKIMSFELGYGLRKSGLTANVNVYRTQWKDRTLTKGFQSSDDEPLFANIKGVNAVHQGIEIDANYRVNNKLTLTGMMSQGDWRWENDVLDVQYFDDEQVLQGTVDLYIADLKVGNSAQTTAALGMNYKLLDGLSFGVDYNYYSNFFADFDPTDRGEQSEAGLDSWEVPAYGVFDFNLTYKFEIAGLKSSLYGNIYNFTDTQYVADAQDGSGRNASTSTVYYGYGRNWNLGLRIKF